jgi:hypothetical protein
MFNNIRREANDDPAYVPREETTMSWNRQDHPSRRKLLFLHLPKVLVKPSWALVDKNLRISDR